MLPKREQWEKVHSEVDVSLAKGNKQLSNDNILEPFEPATSPEHQMGDQVRQKIAASTIFSFVSQCEYSHLKRGVKRKETPLILTREAESIDVLKFICLCSHGFW